jgi:hypothetical protein
MEKSGFSIIIYTTIENKKKQIQHEESKIGTLQFQEESISRPR